MKFIKVITSMVIASLLAMPIQAVSSSNEVIINHNADWGSTLYDYLEDSDGNLLITKTSASRFDLDVTNKSSNIKSVNIVSLDEGPTGSDISTGHYIAVRIILRDSSEEEITRKTFKVNYRITCESDILSPDDDEDVLLNEDDELEGGWEGEGSATGNLADTRISVYENTDKTIWQGDPDDNIRSLISFAGVARFAVEWSADEDPRNLKFSTKLPDIDNFYGRSIQFLNTPSFDNVGRFIFLSDDDDFQLCKVVDDGNELEPIEDSWYDKSIDGYVYETRTLDWFALVDKSILEEQTVVEEEDQIYSINTTDQTELEEYFKEESAESSTPSSSEDVESSIAEPVNYYLPTYTESEEESLEEIIKLDDTDSEPTSINFEDVDVESVDSDTPKNFYEEFYNFLTWIQEKTFH